MTTLFVAETVLTFGGREREMRTTNAMDAVNGAPEGGASVGAAAAAAAAASTKSGFAKAAAGVVARSAIQINMGELLLPLSQLGGKD